jgi:putative adhesin
MRFLRFGKAGLAAAALLVAAPVVADEVTKTLRAEFSGADVSNFSIENLAGTMRVTPGTDGAVSVVVTIHAETQALADGVRFERVSAAGEPPVWRVRYPDHVGTIRYRAPLGEDTYQISLGLLSFSSSSYRYDGRTYRISPGHGKRLWADVLVRVPPLLTRARFQNVAGLVDAEGLHGSLRFEVASADLHLRDIEGELSLHGSSGDVRASEIRGTWSSDFSSGDCDLYHFEGETASFTTSSGDVHARDVRAGGIGIETSSGDVSIEDSDLEEFRGRSSSGDLVLELNGDRLKDVQAHTSSGNVTLRLPRDASFEASASQSSGDMEVGFSGGISTRHDDKLVGYRRGSNGTRIRIETSSGDLEISPR